MAPKNISACYNYWEQYAQDNRYNSSEYTADSA